MSPPGRAGVEPSQWLFAWTPNQQDLVKSRAIGYALFRRISERNRQARVERRSHSLPPGSSGVFLQSPTVRNVYCIFMTFETHQAMRLLLGALGGGVLLSIGLRVWGLRRLRSLLQERETTTPHAEGIFPG